jgi:hypothetical protein
MELSSTISRSKKEETSGTGFSEVMSGFVYTGSDVEDFRVATDLARSRCETARFFLTVNSYDISEREQISYSFSLLPQRLTLD